MHEDNDKLYQDIAIGDRYQKAWEQLVEPFFLAKQSELFDTYKACSVKDIETMKEIVHHCKVLDSMKDEFMNYINTGKLAKQMVKE